MAEQTAIANSGTSVAAAVSTAGQLLRVLEEAGLSEASLRGPIDDVNRRRELVVAWEQIFNSQADDIAASCTLAAAAQIMGGNYHGPAEAKKHFGGRWGAKQWKSVPFSPVELHAVADTHVLVAVPAVSIMDVHAKAPQAFYSQRDPWYGERRQKNVFSDKPTKPGWYLVRKEEVPSSPGLNYERQCALVQAPDFVPEANLAVYAWVLHYLDSGERMFSRYWLRTNSLTAGGYRVNVDEFGDGLDVDFWDDDADGNVSVASARKSG